MFRSILIATIAVVAAGCGAPSLLITPVSSSRALEETVLIRDSLFSRDKIALIDVSGIIMNDHSPKLIGEGEHPVSRLLEQLAAARRDPRVKAVLLRINSPGGTVVASELMHDEITHFRQTGKPVIAVLMDVAASGGYYIACACDEIVAQPSTVTGSIGVIMQMFEVSETMKMIGIKSDAIVSGPAKDSGSPLRPMRDAERDRFQTIVDEMYGRFVAVVAEGRPNLDEAGVRGIADGRIYTAAQAMELGLIDRIASVRETIEQTKERVGAKSIKLIAYKRPSAYRPNYYAAAPTPGGDVNLFNLDLPSWFDRATPRFMYLWAPGR